MIIKPTRDQAIALAGVFQACQLVDNLAQTGSIPSALLSIEINSLLEQSPESAEAVFSDGEHNAAKNLEIGIETIQQLFRDKYKNRRPDTLRYIIGVMHLQRKVSKNPALLEHIGKGIERAKAQAEHFTPSHENVIANIADVYQNTISTQRFRIQVSGQANHLQQTSVANRVRCLLFAAIRAAILWQQLGGRRWHFFVFRGDILRHLEALQQGKR
ncbi:MAG: high frequency lysogenization protein HflD [Gammaproteobacteria bacterium]|nr:high frequency lysogenization protein HflD [Gammaproteobacteria bacterium]MBQ0840616.1 high frequency lysogenization protein HflD [Gammaproteobacteria bacterium]